MIKLLILFTIFFMPSCAYESVFSVNKCTAEEYNNNRQHTRNITDIRLLIRLYNMRVTHIGSSECDFYRRELKRWLCYLEEDRSTKCKYEYLWD